MKRKTLTTAVLAGLTGVAGMAGVANAVNLNPDGLGQVLLYPYYSAKGGNDTLISVVNTTDEAKAIKIRFIEALNSREVLDFNIYMSMHDVWTAAITATEDGGAKIRVSDRTCTAPGMFRGAHADAEVREVPFRSFQYQADGGPSGIDRTASGYIEILEMGTLVGTTAQAVTHVSGEPNNCDVVHEAWETGGFWANNASVDIEPPSGGLFGGALIVNVDHGTMFSYNATAIDGWRTTEIHTRPESLSPSLGDGDNTESNVFINGVVDTQTWLQPIQAVNAVITHNTIMNEFVVGAGAAAHSEWVITFPTKRFHVDAAPDGPQPNLPAPVPPFSSLWTADAPGACEAMNVRIWDREEGGVAPDDLDFSPIEPGDPPFSLCAEANVVRWNNEPNGELPDVAEITREPLAGIFGYRNFSMPERFDAGWARFDFSARTSVPSVEGNVYRGLPVIGFWVNTFTNEVLDVDGVDVLSNYGGTFNHRGTRLVDAES